MALDPQTVTTLYRKYLGRSLTPEQLSEVTSGQGAYANFQTPQALENLLASTSNSLRGKTVSNIGNTISSITNSAPSYSLYGGRLPDYGTFEAQNPQLQGALSGYDAALQRYDTISQQAAAQPSRTTEMLKAGAEYFGDTPDQLRQKFGDPKSPWYVSDPVARSGILNRILGQRSATLQDTITKIGDIYNVLTTAANNQLAGQKEKIDAIRSTIEKSYNALMQFYGEEYAAQHRGGGSPTAGLTDWQLMKRTLPPGYDVQLQEGGPGVNFIGPEGLISPQQWSNQTGVNWMTAAQARGSQNPADWVGTTTGNRLEAAGGEYNARVKAIADGVKNGTIDQNSPATYQLVQQLLSDYPDQAAQTTTVLKAAGLGAGT